MAKTTSVKDLYSRGRVAPHGRNHDQGSEHRIAHEPDMRPETVSHRTRPAHHGEAGHPHHNDQVVQDAEGRHGARYDNDVPEDSWLRGGGAGGCDKPGFDYSPARNRMRR